jgi:glyoxylase-like metal-dependent hydrolase (beta-lactamase superfamily II)
VTSLLDGISTLTDAHFPAAVANPHRLSALRRAAGFLEGPMPLPFNAFTFEISGTRYLVDAGNSRRFNPLTGRLDEALAAAGISPAAIDVILVTHGHVDHVAGLLTPGGERAFPNAEVVIPRTELEFWSDETRIAGAREDIGRIIANVAPALKAYADRMRPFDGTPDIAPGLASVAIDGHTPAHTGYMLGSGTDRLFFWGDIVHLAALQLPEPDWSIVYDVDPVKAVATRRRVLEMVVSQDLRVAGAHLPGGGIGYITCDGDSYRFTPSL